MKIKLMTEDELKLEITKRYLRLQKEAKGKDFYYGLSFAGHCNSVTFNKSERKNCMPIFLIDNCFENYKYILEKLKEEEKCLNLTAN